MATEISASRITSKALKITEQSQCSAHMDPAKTVVPSPAVSPGLGKTASGPEHASLSMSAQLSCAEIPGVTTSRFVTTSLQPRPKARSPRVQVAASSRSTCGKRPCKADLSGWASKSTHLSRASRQALSGKDRPAPTTNNWEDTQSR